MPTLIDLFCGRGGWTRAAMKRGWTCYGFDCTKHEYPGEQVLTWLPCQTATLETLKPDLIVASPPCEDFARKHLPWIKLIGPVDETHLRWAIGLNAQLTCPVIIECSQFAARHVPGWTRCGSFYLWGAIPALLPTFKHHKNAHAGNKEDGQAIRAAKKAMIPNTLADWLLWHREQQLKRLQGPELTATRGG